MEYNQAQYPNALPGYLENPASRAFYHADLKNTLEGVVLNPKPEKQSGILEKVFSDKGKTLKGTVKALLNEIQLREALDSHLLRKIDQEISRQNTDLMQIADVKTDYSPDLARYISKTRIQLENNVLELEKEKRKEYLECWRDLMFLKKYLLASLKDYWDMTQKRKLLSHDLSELTKNKNPEGR